MEDTILPISLLRIDDDRRGVCSSGVLSSVLSYLVWLSTSQVNLVVAGTEGRRGGAWILQ